MIDKKLVARLANSALRVDARGLDQIREVKITPGFQEYPHGSALIEIGKTRVICSAMHSPRVPPHLMGSGKGWVTAEYAMLPGASQQRVMRDGVKGKINGRSHEIQRLIGRSLRSVIDMDRMGERQFLIDCDVLQADGGTRTAAITGAFVALALAIQGMEKRNEIARNVIKDYCAAVSVGMVEGRPLLDLCYLEDAQAEVDMNVVMTGSGRFVEIQGTAEETPFDIEQLAAMLKMARQGVTALMEAQKAALGGMIFGAEKS